MSGDEITSEHTFARIGQVLEELEALRLEMGRTRDARVPMHVSDASPREVFYHAQTVHRKASQLCAELGAGPADPPRTAEPGRALPSDVLAFLDGTRERLVLARSLLRIDGDSYRPQLPGPLSRVAGKTPSDVLAGCLIASRQLNVMLEHAFAARECREQLIRALGLTERLLAVHGAGLPAAPPHERRKFPRDVFQLLWQACEVLHQLLNDSRIKALEIHRGFVGEEPTDVYDLASLIVSELEYLNSFLPARETPPRTAETAMPVPVLPAHNYRLALQLRAAFGELAAAVRARPEWLGSARG
jgi:hypothetical protein